MSAGILPDEGIAAQMQYILSADIVGVLPWELMIWTNDYEPDNSTTLADLVEASWYGYSRASLDRSLWTVPTVLDGCARSTWGTDPLVWTVGSSTPVVNHGVAYVDRMAGVLRWVQRFDDADLRPTELGMQVKILPVYTLTSAECGSEFGIFVSRPRPKKRRR